ncbi:heat shock 70 kDa protein 12A-like isoform X2 [Dreissena polymorpha]|uniref:heat shock 70 kDa protein 12A-like isoform X2 n=1 Tax=Dreissena polymorpha TaxID=45954 RepID=UPI002263FD54|nr:heat shock 70 kDa protein 12A-like isoform X2 [Dreissena polymorpha]
MFLLDHWLDVYSYLRKARSGAPLIVAAIDFGTTFSGWACSFRSQFESDPSNVFVRPWNGFLFISSKAPTCVLIKPDGKTPDAFGFDAEYRYAELSENDSHKQWYFFQRFKLMLLNKPIHQDTMLVDQCGKPLPALRVLSLAIRYMVNDLRQWMDVNTQVSGFNLKDDIHWVLTVPAIWNDAAKDFMSLAAQEAGLLMTQITIVLEPVAASLFCIEDREQKERFEFLPGHKFLVLDAGGTDDIAVYEVCFGRKLKEVYKATGGFCGGAMVNKAFEEFLQECTGREAFERFKKENMEDFADLMRRFELIKRNVDTSFSGKKALFMPKPLIELVDAINGISFRELIQGSRYTRHADLAAGQKLLLDASIVHSFFKQSIDSIHILLAAALRQSATLGVDTIIMVGGYAESPILQEAIKTKFPGMKVIVSSEAGCAVLKGAVIFGHRPIEVSSLKDSPTAFASDFQASWSKDLGKRGDQQTREPQRPSWSTMPSNWEPMKPDEIFRQVCLPNTGDEFKRVLSNFIQTLDNRKILFIYRIQSTFLWEHYCVKKKEMEKINGMNGAEEKILFHGTKPDIIESICAENLDMRLAGSNVGAILGHGTYFATAAKMSDCYATPDTKSGHRYMLQCRVLVGRWTKGEKGLRRPPEITESVSGGYRRRYNSCVDNVQNPRIFCIFDHVQYYPEYVLEYE